VLDELVLDVDELLEELLEESLLDSDFDSDFGLVVVALVLLDRESVL